MFLTTLLYAQDLYIQKGNYRVTYETISFLNENMGLVGTGLIFGDNFYSGIGIYSAVTGKRGGFFTGGVEFGKKTKIGQFYNDIGCFVGGGGGGSAPQGGGLMIRPHIGLLYGYFGVSYSKVLFPNGDIDSNQFSLQFDYPFRMLFKHNNSNKVDITGYKWSDDYFAIIYQRYIPHHSKTTTNQKLTPISLLGFEYGNYYDNFATYIEASGAGGGNSDGYAEFLGGVKFEKKFSNLGVYLKMGIGASGGGKVDTGGGLVSKEGIGVSGKIGNFGIVAEGGHIDSIKGKFHSAILKGALNYELHFLGIEGLDKVSFYNEKEYHIDIYNQTYLQKINNNNINLIGIKISKYYNNLYFSSDALGAYKGEAGGYAVGLVGVGYRYFDVSCGVDFGVAGGGGVDVGGGFIYQANVGYEYDIDQDISLKLSILQTKAFKGLLDTTALNIGIVYKFRVIEGYL